MTERLGNVCLNDDIFTDPCALSLPLSQRARWYELCRLAARQKRRGVIPPIPGAGLARALGTYPHILERVLGTLEGLGLVERPGDGSICVPLLCPDSSLCEPDPNGAASRTGTASQAGAADQGPAAGVPLGLEGMSRTALYNKYGTTSPRKILAVAGSANGRESTNGRNGHGADVPRGVPGSPQNVQDATHLERFTAAQDVPKDVLGDVPPSRASENVPNVPTFSEEKENINILSEENVRNVNVPTLNVAGRNVPDVPQNVPGGPRAVPDLPTAPAASAPPPRLGGQALIDCNAAVNQLLNFTGDGKSRNWFEKLWKVCHHTGHLDLWGKALKDTGRASTREDNRVATEALGKYFGKTLEPMLILAGVPLEMVVSEGRRAEARQAAADLRRRWAQEDADE